MYFFSTKTDVAIVKLYLDMTHWSDTVLLPMFARPFLL